MQDTLCFAAAGYFCEGRVKSLNDYNEIDTWLFIVNRIIKANTEEIFSGIRKQIKLYNIH